MGKHLGIVPALTQRFPALPLDFGLEGCSNAVSTVLVSRVPLCKGGWRASLWRIPSM